MIINVKYFNEETDNDYIEHEKIWDNNKERFILLQDDLPIHEQISNLKNEIHKNKKRDILAVLFPEISIISENSIINDIIVGKGFIYDNNKTWFPKEIWVYSPK